MIIAFIVIGLPILLMAGLTAIAAVIGRAGGTLSAGTIVLMVVVLLVLIAAAAGVIRAATKT